jgi:branched-chain amino acid transport system substrate-binding protein
VRHQFGKRAKALRGTTSAAAVMTAIALTAAACGGSSTPSSTTASNSPGNDNFLSAPLKLAFLWSIKGEDAASADYYNNGGAMAIEEINAAGGVGGQQIQTVRYQSSPLDPQNVVTNFLKAVDAKPAMIIGLAAPSAEAASSAVTKAGIPTFSITQDQNLNLGAKAGSPWLWTTVTNDGLQAVVAAKFVTENLKAKSVGLLHTNESFGMTGSGIQKKILTAAGVKITANVPYAVDATDLTGPVLAVKSSDAVIDWGYPNPVGIQLNQFVQNNINIPTVTGGAAPYVVQGKLAKANALAKFYSIDPCNPADNSAANVVTWRNAYEAKYKEPANASAAEAYDAVYLAVAAIKKAQSIDPQKIKDAIGSLKYTEGICTTDFHADGAHNLMHSNTVISWATGVGKTQAVIPTADQSEGVPDPK